MCKKKYVLSNTHAEIISERKKLFFYSRLLPFAYPFNAISCYSCILLMLKINQLNSLTFVKYIYTKMIYIQSESFSCRMVVRIGKTITIVGHENYNFEQCLTFTYLMPIGKLNSFCDQRQIKKKKKTN